MLKLSCEVCSGKFNWLQILLGIPKIPMRIRCKSCQTNYALTNHSILISIVLVCIPLILFNHKMVFVNTFQLIIYLVALVLLFLFWAYWRKE